RRSRRGCRRRSSPPPCTSASTRATSATSATRSCRRCATSSAATKSGTTSVPLDLEVTNDEKAAARRAAELIAAAGAAAVADHGHFALAMSGGRSPWAMLAILGDLEEMPWRETELFQVDERIASPGSEDRNLTHMVLGLSMDHQSALRPMPVTNRDLDA